MTTNDIKIHAQWMAEHVHIRGLFGFAQPKSRLHMHTWMTSYRCIAALLKSRTLLQNILHETNASAADHIIDKEER